MEQVKVNVGCAANNPAGFIGIDIVKPSRPPKVFVGAEALFLPFREGTVDEIMSSHTVEHLGPVYFAKSLQNWYRALKIGGTLMIRCPNALVYVRELVECFEKDIENLKDVFWPVTNVTGLADRGDHMVNRNMFSVNSLALYVSRAGFTIDECKTHMTRQSHGAEHRMDGDLCLMAHKERD